MSESGFASLGPSLLARKGGDIWSIEAEQPVLAAIQIGRPPVAPSSSASMAGSAGGGETSYLRLPPSAMRGAPRRE
jgi:hypothetical protein